MEAINFIKHVIKETKSYSDEVEFHMEKNSISNIDDFNNTNKGGNSIGNESKIIGKGHCWIYNNFTFDKKIKGIDILGTRLMLRAFIVAPTKVYINNELVFHEGYWADFNLPEVVISDCYKGEEIDIKIHLEVGSDVQPTGDAFKVTLFIEKIEDIVFDIETFLNEMEFISQFDELTVLHKNISDCLNERIDKDTDILTILDIVHEQRTKMEEYKYIVKQYTCHLVGHAHIDMNWLWPQQETERIVGRDFDTVTKLLTMFEDLRFSQSQVAVYDIAKRLYPETYEKIKGKVESGNWDITASTWVEGDLNMAQGETISRHLLYSRKFIKDEFGVDVDICWEPDTFGHSASMPQILNKSNIGHYYHYRCDDGHPLYVWEGNDGSKLLSFTSIYLNPITSDEVVKISSRLKKDYDIKNSLFVYGVGDHGGGPTIRHIKKAQFLNECPGMPTIKFSKIMDFFSTITEDEKQMLHSRKGEMNIVFDGCYTSTSDVKKLNRFLENTLVDVEKTEYLCSLYGKQYNEDGIYQIYKDLMFFQFHDILCGCSIHESNEYTIDVLGKQHERVEKMLDENIAYLTDRLSIEDDNSIVVWNMEGYTRDDIASFEVDSNSYVVVDAEGNEVLSSYYDGKLYFKAEDVPSLGRKNYYLSAKKNDADNTWKVEEDERTFKIDSDIFELEIDKESGCIVHLYDKENNYTYVKKREWRDVLFDYNNNVFSVEYEAPHDMSAWAIGPIVRKDYLLTNAEVKIVHDDQFMKVISIKHKVASSHIEEMITVYKDYRRIDFNVNVEWNEKGGFDKDSPMLKLAFAPQLVDDVQAYYQIPFSTIERKKDGIEYPALKWVDVNDGNNGYGIFNDSKYGYMKEGNKMNITCIRSSYAPDPEPDTKDHTFNIALYPHKGTVEQSDINKKGQSFSSPFVVKRCNDTVNEDIVDEFVCHVDNSSVILSSIKKCIADDSMIMRLYQPYDIVDSVNVTFSRAIESVWEIAITEDSTFRKVEHNDMSFSDKFNKYEIKTYKVNFKK